MKIHQRAGWINYVGNVDQFKFDDMGKWMYFFKPEQLDFVSEKCAYVVEKGLIAEAKHTDKVVLNIKKSGVACFYIDFDDKEAHKKLLNYFLANDMIPKTKVGIYNNIPFKLDSQTLAKEYGKNFTPKLSLEDFLDLSTGQWKI